MTSADSCWDIVIAGAGLAGLSLAVELAQPEFANLRILLIEPRKAYVRDRTWSYWALPHALPARWQHLSRCEWPAWRVSLGERIAISSKQLKYESVRSDDFYDSALALITKAPHIEWLKETAIDQVLLSQSGVDLMTNTGSRLSCQMLFDSRPPSIQDTSDWVQHFTGWEVQTKQPRFEPQCVDLMAFEPALQGLHFFYCLPYSSTQALVESTWISRASVRADATQELREALKRRWGCEEFEIIFREQGALPLLPSLPAKQKQVVRVGRAGGMLRAATGYAFCATLHQTAGLAISLARHLKQGGSLQAWQAPKYATHAMDQWMDQVLFRVLERDWQAAPAYFLQLFEKVPELSLIRFLQGQARWQDRWAVMRALPAWPFVRAAVG